MEPAGGGGGMARPFQVVQPWGWGAPAAVAASTSGGTPTSPSSPSPSPPTATVTFITKGGMATPLPAA